MAKYSERLVAKIAALVEEDTYNISEICDIFRISRKTFYEWKETKPEFSEALQKAEARRDENMLALARASLRKKLEGYTVIEEKTTYVPDRNCPDKLVLKTKVVKRKQCPPDNAAIKQVLLKDEQKQRTAEAEKAAQEPEEPELVIEFNSNKARRNYEFLQTMLKAGVPNDKWQEYSYNPAYMNEEEEEGEKVTAG